MKKFLMLAAVAAFLGASVGCDDKKTSASKPVPANTSTTGAKTTTP